MTWLLVITSTSGKYQIKRKHEHYIMILRTTEKAMYFVNIKNDENKKITPKQKLLQV